MKNKIRKIAGAGMLLCASAMGPQSAQAAIGVVSLIGGPGGIILIKTGAAIAFGGSAAVGGACYVGIKTANWSEDCPIFVNFTFWPGAALLSANDASTSLEIASQLSTQYHADSASANRIADRIYNKAILASKAVARDQAPPSSNERLVVQAKVSLSLDELKELAEPEFATSEGFAQLVQDYQ